MGGLVNAVFCGRQRTSGTFYKVAGPANLSHGATVLGGTGGDRRPLSTVQWTIATRRSLIMCWLYWMRVDSPPEGWAVNNVWFDSVTESMIADASVQHSARRAVGQASYSRRIDLATSGGPAARTARIGMAERSLRD